MKNTKKIIFTIFFVLTLCIVLFSNGVFANYILVSNNTENKVLDKVERHEYNFETGELEQKISIQYLKKEELINDAAKEAMLVYNVSDADINEYNDVYLIKDKYLNREIRRLENDSVQIDFNSEGNIVCFKNKEDFPQTDKDKRDYVEFQELPQIEYSIKNIEQIQETLNDIVSVNNLQEYKMVECNNDIEGVWNITWNKILFDNVVNPYDVATVSIDAKDGSIMLFSRNTIEPESINVIVTEEQAIEIAKKMYNQNVNSSDILAQLTTFRPNFYWEKGGPYEEADFIRVAWKITIERNTIIMVDAETGEILGGDTKMADGARAMSLVPTFYKAAERADAAAEAFERLGYVQPYACQPHTGWVKKEDVMWVINHKSLYGLFISAHGLEDENGNFLNAITDGENWTLYSSEVSGNWHFVYLAGCLTSSTDAFAKAFKTKGYSGRCFVGNNNSVSTRTSYEFIINFCGKLGSKSVLNCVLEARQEVLNAGHDDCNPGFIGDSNYYGWAW